MILYYDTISHSHNLINQKTDIKHLVTNVNIKQKIRRKKKKEKNRTAKKKNDLKKREWRFIRHIIIKLLFFHKITTWCAIKVFPVWSIVKKLRLRGNKFIIYRN